MPNVRVPNIDIEGAQLRFKNFAGKGDRFNPEGQRNFCVLVDPAAVDALRVQGWNVKFLKPKEEGMDPVPYLKVKVNFTNVPPAIYLVTYRNGQQKVTKIGEDAVASLDFAEIETADITISPYNYNVNGATGLSAYLKTMYVTLVQDAFAEKYADPNSEGDIPF